MNKQNIENLEEETRKRAGQRDKKKRKNMKVSGSSVKNLQRIIKNKCDS